MSEEPFDPRTTNLREVFPWLHLFRGFRLASDLKKIALGSAGVLLMLVGWAGLRLVIGADDPVEPVALMPWQGRGAGEIDPYRSPLDGGWTSHGLPSAALLVLEPYRQLAEPIRMMFRSPRSAWVGVAMMAWGIVVWALFGGASTRIAAVQTARNGNVGIFEALRFAAGRWFTYLGAPLLPFLGVVLIGVFCLLGGLLSRIPVLDIALAPLWFLPLAAGFVMAVALFGLALGWPLMFAAISAEATESFDAVSRAYNYVLGRPWQFLFYLVVALLYGSVVSTLVVIVVFTAVSLSQFAIAFGSGEETARALYAYAPIVGHWRESLSNRAAIEQLAGTQRIAAMIIGGWLHLALVALLGFVYSYFWSTVTLIYFLLRGDVDETDFEEVYLDEEEEEPFPTVAPSAPLRPEEEASAATRHSLPIVDPPPSG